MKNDKEMVGTLLGFDDFVNMLLEDVTEYESTPEGRRVTKLDKILLNGNNITMVAIYCSSLLNWLIDYCCSDAPQKGLGRKRVCEHDVLFQLVPGGEMPD